MRGWDLEVLAASLRAGTSDLSMYAGFLINTLSASLPGEMVQVDRKSGLFGRVKPDAPVLAVTVRLGDHQFTLERDDVGKPVTARIRHESGGVVLRTETVGMDVWAGRMAAALAEYAQSNAAAAELLQRLTSPEMP